ncbi:MAG: DEAD/DEAH box helicase, partial [Planctomycetaceae bacterium]
VVVNRPLEMVYSYLVPDELREIIGPGQRVRVPFGRGNKPILGFCVGLGSPPEIDRELKSVESVIDREPLLPPSMLELTRWISEEYLCGWGQVLESVLPAGVKNKAGTRLFTFYTVTDEVCQRAIDLNLTPKQRAVLNVLCEADGPMRGEDLAEKAGCGASPIESLRKKGILRALRQRLDSFAPNWGNVEPSQDFQLNDDQQRALDVILEALRGGEHRTLLLHGVTGSGKTEVYMQAIREIVGYGRQAIVLVPEISLTPQTIRRFRGRFDSVAVLHSHLTDAERHWHWQQIAAGGVQVVVGARSAVFAPTSHLGLIVIDEEHETSFKQDSVPRYHTREVARRRAQLEEIPLVLGSATPTLESF